MAAHSQTLDHGSGDEHAAAMIKGPVVSGLPVEILRELQSRRAQRLSESRRVVWVAAHLADHPLAAGAVRHKVKGDGDDEFAYVCDACVERALTCRSRAALTRMLAFHIWLLLGRLWDHSKQSPMSLFHLSANCESDGAIL